MKTLFGKFREILPGLYHGKTVNVVINVALFLLMSKAATSQNGVTRIEFEEFRTTLEVRYMAEGQTKKHHCGIEQAERLMDELYYHASAVRHSPRKSKKQMEDTARRMYSFFLEPGEDLLLERLEISAPEWLGIPWGALIDPQGSYLIENHIIVVNFPKTKSSERVPTVKKGVVVRPDLEGEKKLYYHDTENNKGRLPQATLFCEKVGSKNELTNLLATQELGILHFSTHNELDSNKVENSGLVLEGESRLAIKDIRNLSVSAEMVFLNACSTARSINRKSDCGKGSVLHTFGDAGVKAGIGTLWEIDDRSAQKLAKTFYEYLHLGQSKATALRNAQLSLLNDEQRPRYQHPYNWGAYVFYGDDTPVVPAQKTWFSETLSVLFSAMTTFSFLSFYFGQRLKKAILFRHFL